MKDISKDYYQNPEAFKAARIKLGLSQTSFAQILGLTDNHGSIMRYEKGKRTISGPLARLVWLLVKHGIPPAFLP